MCDRHNVHGKEDRGNVYSQVSWEKIYSETVGQDKELVYCTTGILTLMKTTEKTACGAGNRSEE